MGARRQRTGAVTLFLAGDVMTGRGIDQVLPTPSEPRIYEPFVDSALGYVELAERVSGAIRRPVGLDYVWGDALGEIDERAPDWRIVNLETAVTTSEDAERKGINYRMHPGNVRCLGAARLDCCVLANNHVLDWGIAGLRETLEVLDAAGFATAGAGRDAAEAQRPTVLAGAPGRPRVLVFAFATPSSGVPGSWAATRDRPGVNLLPDLSRRTAERVGARIAALRRPEDLVVVSVHWGGNWGYEVPREHRDFAHRLVHAGAADVVHGHSSHHRKGIEVYGGRPVLYGCGDFMNDYEGIGGHEEYRPELVLGYLLELDASGELTNLTAMPFRLRRFRLERAAAGDAEWLRQVLDREGRSLGTSAVLAEDGSIDLRW